MDMNYILAINPADYNSTDIFRSRPYLTPAITGLYVRRDGNLYISENIGSMEGCFLFITFEYNANIRNYERLAGEIIYVCRKYNTGGIILNGYEDTKADSLIRLLKKNIDIKIYISSEMKSSADCIKVVSSAISGGTLSDMLKSYGKVYGPEHIALAAELIRSDFTLPAFSGTGRELTLDQTRDIIEKYRTSSFYSSELETNYFTYKDSGKAHMVLYDNSYSIRRKILLGKSLGIREVFLNYGDTRNIIDRIFTDPLP